jgi:hypothetical protein
VKKLLCVLTVAIVTPLLGGCFETGSSAPPPPWLPSTSGDGRVKLEWTPTAGVEYWVFSATDPSLTAFNWTGLPNAMAVVAAPTPTYMCGLVDEVNGTALTYYFATNGRINGGPGGPSSPTISATPYNAATASNAWKLNTSFSANVYGLGYASLTTCANNTALSATGTFAAVGAGGAIFTSPDAISWTGQSSPVTTNLNAVAGYATNLNNATTPGLYWAAVGDGGKAVYRTDGINWTAGTSTTTQNLRSIVHVAGGTFYAVGDSGTIMSSTNNGMTWTSVSSTPTTSHNLNGVSYTNGLYVAVGDGGTILTNSSNWVPLPYSAPPTSGLQPASTSPTTQNLRQVAAIATVYGSIYVAVGDNGTIVTSDSYLHNGRWTLVSSPNVPASASLVGVTVEPRGVETQTAYTTAPAVDPWLGFISAAQFVAMDSSGNTYTSINGYDWTASTGTGMAACTTCIWMNPLISSGFGYVAAGDNGQTAYAF